MSNNLEEKKSKIRSAFKFYDRDGTGSIDIKQLGNLISDLAGNYEFNQVQQAILALNKEKSGMVELAKFESWWINQFSDSDEDASVREVEKALEKLKNIEQKRFHQDIHTASWNGHVDVVERLLEEAKNINAVDETEFGEGNYPLHYAAYNGHTAVCRILIKNKANISCRNDAGCTPLYLAAQQGHAVTVNFLLEHGADPRIRDKVHEMSVIDVTTSDSVIEAFKKLKGENPPIPDAPKLLNPTSTTLQLKWNEPNPTYGDIFPISGYKIKYTKSGDTKSKYTVSNAKPTEIMLENLEPFSEYVAHVASINLSGASDYSNKSNSLKTNPAPPDPPELFQATDVTSDSVCLSWNAVAVSSASDIQYNLFINTDDDHWSLEKKIAGSETKYIVKKLLSGKKYRFRIASSSQYGMGKYTKTLNVTTTLTLQKGDLREHIQKNFKTSSKSSKIHIEDTSKVYQIQINHAEKKNTLTSIVNQEKELKHSLNSSSTNISAPTKARRRIKEEKQDKETKDEDFSSLLSTSNGSDVNFFSSNKSSSIVNKANKSPENRKNDSPKKKKLVIMEDQIKQVVNNKNDNHGLIKELKPRVHQVDNLYTKEDNKKIATTFEENKTTVNKKRDEIVEITKHEKPEAILTPLKDKESLEEIDKAEIESLNTEKKKRMEETQIIESNLAEDEGMHRMVYELITVDTLRRDKPKTDLVQQDENSTLIKDEKDITTYSHQHIKSASRQDDSNKNKNDEDHEPGCHNLHVAAEPKQFPYYSRNKKISPSETQKKEENEKKNDSHIESDGYKYYKRSSSSESDSDQEEKLKKKEKK